MADCCEAFVEELQSANAVDNVIRMDSPQMGQPEDLNKGRFFNE
jgi:hypothetical protein